MLTCWGEPGTDAWHDAAFEPPLRMQQAHGGARLTEMPPDAALSRREWLALCKVGGAVRSDQGHLRLLRSLGPLRTVQVVTMRLDGQDLVTVLDVLAFQFWKTFRTAFGGSGNEATGCVAMRVDSGRDQAILGWLASSLQAWGDLPRWQAPGTDTEAEACGKVPVQARQTPQDVSRAGPTTMAEEAPAWSKGLGATLLGARHLVESDAKAAASLAVGDMRRLARASSLPTPDASNVSEEGLVSLVWEGERKALLVVFSGDGDASYSIKDKGGLFVEITDFTLEEGLPDPARLALDVPTSP